MRRNRKNAPSVSGQRSLPGELPRSIIISKRLRTLGVAGEGRASIAPEANVPPSHEELPVRDILNLLPTYLTSNADSPIETLWCLL